ARVAEDGLQERPVPVHAVVGERVVDDHATPRIGGGERAQGAKQERAVVEDAQKRRATDVLRERERERAHEAPFAVEDRCALKLAVEHEQGIAGETLEAGHALELAWPVTLPTG